MAMTCMCVHVCMSRLIARHSDAIPRCTPNANLIVAMVTISPGRHSTLPISVAKWAVVF